MPRGKRVVVKEEEKEEVEVGVLSPAPEVKEIKEFEGKKVVNIIGEKKVGAVKFITVRCDDGATYDVRVDE